MSYTKWTQDELDFIAKNAVQMKDQELADAISAKRGNGLKLSVQVVRKQRKRLGIVKSPGRGVGKVLEVNAPAAGDSAKKEEVVSI